MPRYQIIYLALLLFRQFFLPNKYFTVWCQSVINVLIILNLLVVLWSLNSRLIWPHCTIKAGNIIRLLLSHSHDNIFYLLYFACRAEYRILKHFEILVIQIIKVPVYCCQNYWDVMQNWVLCTSLEVIWLKKFYLNHQKNVKYHYFLDLFTINS